MSARAASERGKAGLADADDSEINMNRECAPVTGAQTVVLLAQFIGARERRGHARQRESGASSKRRAAEDENGHLEEAEREEQRDGDKNFE